MDELFSCRNCIHNCAQSLNTGVGSGYCLTHTSVILEPDRTTCKYLHRKDLPRFVVDEGIREHASEFALFPRLATLDTKQSVERLPYSEKYAWDQGTYDPLTHALAQYYKVERRWVLVQAFTGGTDGRRSLVHASLIRHYMDHCNTWTSSYRLVLGLIEEVDETPRFDRKALVATRSASDDENALWDVVFARLSAIQEYGWHAGLEELLWASDSVNGALVDLNWKMLQAELSRLRSIWISQVITHAKKHDVYFPLNEPPEEF